ncbi:MAG: hypothetical protein PWQ10_269 [Patescibacteria group bacterium]|nr:hypothetical protein [Patescibacteria group bacterium]
MNKTSITIRKTAKKLFHNLAKSHTRKRTILRFADKMGLLYFGTVDQHTDEHKVIRGFTVSSSHKDSNYCVGSVNSYDIRIVDRSDTIAQPDGSISVYNWLIMSFDLHTRQDIPHLFLGARNKNLKDYRAFFDTFPNLKEIELGTFEHYEIDFTSRFSLNARPTDSIQVERLFPADTTRVIGTHFWPLSAEQYEGVLYIYSDDLKISSSLMNTMIENGLWLANHLDNRAELV